MPLSRSDVPSDTREHFENLELKFGSKIVPIKSDISSIEGLKHLEEKLNGLPSIAGIVNSAGILDDKMFMEIDRQSYREVMASKVNGKDLPIFYKRSSSLSNFSSRKAAVIREDAINDAKRDSWGLEYRGQFEYNNLISGQEAISGQLFYTYAKTKSNQNYDHQEGQWQTKSTTLGDISPHKVNFIINVPITTAFNLNIKANYLHRTPLYSRNPLSEQDIEVASRIIFDTAIGYQYAQ